MPSSSACRSCSTCRVRASPPPRCLTPMRARAHTGKKAEYYTENATRTRARKSQHTVGVRHAHAPDRRTGSRGTHHLPASSLCCACLSSASMLLLLYRCYCSSPCCCCCSCTSLELHRFACCCCYCHDCFWLNIVPMGVPAAAVRVLLLLACCCCYGCCSVIYLFS